MSDEPEVICACPACEIERGKWVCHDPRGKHADPLAGWNLVGPGTPLNAWLETKKAGEDGSNCCGARLTTIGGEVEWVERETGRTTVTHHSFAPPDYWRWPTPEPK